MRRPATALLVPPASRPNGEHGPRAAEGARRSSDSLSSLKPDRPVRTLPLPLAVLL